MFKVPTSGEHHRHAAGISRRDYLGIANRAAGLNGRGGASVSGRQQPVPPERQVRVRVAPVRLPP